jgi:hypothetical protein
MDSTLKRYGTQFKWNDVMFAIKLYEHTQFQKLKPLLFTFIKAFKHSNSLNNLNGHLMAACKLSND